MNREFAGTLRERIVIERPVEERSAMGLSTGGWEQVASCRASIVPEGAGPEAEAMALSAMPRLRVTIRRRDDVAVGQRILWGSRVLMVRQAIDDPRLADRLVLRCEEARA